MDKKRVMIKVGLVLVGIVFLASAIGMAKGYTTPTETVREETLYSHQGEFDYQAYIRPGLFSGEPAPPNPILLLPIIDSAQLFFSYSFLADQPMVGMREKVEIKAILEDQNGRWEKEVSLVKTEKEGNFIISFPLELEKFLELGQSIEKELAPKGTFRGSTWYWLKIKAEVETDFQTDYGPLKDSFLTTLKGKLSPFDLEWEDQFDNFERGWLKELSYWHRGEFGYQIKLKPNILFGPILLERQVNPQLMPIVISPDFPLYSRLIEAIEISFNYQFKNDVQIDSLTEEIKLEMTMEEPGWWKKSFPLVSLTQNQSKFAFTFPLDYEKLREMARNINQRLGVEKTKGQGLTIDAQVHTIAKFGQKTIDEEFKQELKGKLTSEKIELSPNSLSKKGAIKKRVREFNELTLGLRKNSLIGAGASFLILFGLVFLYWRVRPKPSQAEILEKEARRAKRKHKHLISDVEDFPSTREGESIINYSSLEELVKVANLLLRPIFHKGDKDRHLYWILEDLKRHQYLTTPEEPREKMS